MSKMKKSKIDMRIIVISVIGTLIVERVFSLLSHWTGGVVSTLVDFYYLSAASTNGLELIRLLSVMGALLWLGYIVSIPLSNVIVYFRIIRPQNSFHDNNQEDGKVAVVIEEQTETEQEIFAEDVYLKARIDLLKIDLERAKKEISYEAPIMDKTGKAQTKCLRNSIIAIILAVVYFLLLFIYSHMPHTTRHIFETNLIRITPHVEQSEIDTLRSEWVQMQSRADYLEIRGRISLILDEIELRTTQEKTDN